MLSLTDPDTGESVDKQKTPKCLFTHSQLPAYVDENQLPSRRRPFSTFGSRSCVSAVSVALPSLVYEAIKDEIRDTSRFVYSRVVMRPSDLLEIEFLTECVKKGDVLMRSQGKCFEDNFFLLSEGVLRIELDVSTYEKCGLEGKPIESKGRIHIKTRYAIELDLRSPAMLHGKKGFKRVEWAFENVLNEPLSWRYIDLANLRSDEVTGPLSKHNPQTVVAEPTISVISGCLVPNISPQIDLSEPEDAADLFEWVGLVVSNSERVKKSDVINDFYSLYRVPSFPTKQNIVPMGTTGEEKKESKDTLLDQDQTEMQDVYNETQEDDNTSLSAMDVVVLSWSGLIPSKFLISLWLALHNRPRARLLQAQSKEAKTSGVDDGPSSKTNVTTEEFGVWDWSVLSATGFDTQAYAFLDIGKRDVLSWECWD